MLNTEILNKIDPTYDSRAHSERASALTHLFTRRMPCRSIALPQPIVCKSHRVPCVRLSFVFPSNLIEAIPNDLFFSLFFFFNFRFSHFIVHFALVRFVAGWVFFPRWLSSLYFGGSNRVRRIFFLLVLFCGVFGQSEWFDCSCVVPTRNSAAELIFRVRLLFSQSSRYRGGKSKNPFDLLLFYYLVRAQCNCCIFGEN